jgi:roadblock/LC7 domain-containing protein
MKDRFSSRKLIVLTIFSLVGLGMAYLGKLDQVTADFIFKMCAAYMVGNVGAKVAGVLQNKKDEEC